MIYKTLPKVGSIPLPILEVNLTSAERNGRTAPADLVWVHRWGVGDWQHERIQGVVNTFKNPANLASSHGIYAGEVGPDAGQFVQMVPWGDTAWTEAAFNARGLSIEFADAIWLGADPVGFARAARIVAFLLHAHGLPPSWVHSPTSSSRGFTRHADGGGLAGGHTFCPTTDLALFQQFAGRVAAEHRIDGFRPVWGV